MSQTATESRTNAAEFTVSEISVALKRTVEDAFGYVRVRGEISGYRGPHSSGHAYFAMKDERSRLEAVVWKGTMARLRVRPEEGMEVIATGKLTTFPGSSKYQIVIDNLEPAGVGALMALLDERKKRLASEGLFDPARKQLLPHMPGVIGVVTSPTGAVIRDIVHRIRDRFPLHVVVWPVRVQGETCAAEVTAAVLGFNALTPDGAIPRPDLIIVARGGGSLEDLWGFNDEALARAVAASDLPVISAVGHETDWTLIDLVADVRAPTPTGAAEMAVPVRDELSARLANLSARLRAAARRSLERRRSAFRASARALPSLDQMLAMPRRRFDETTSRLERSLSVSVERKRARWRGLRLQPSALSRRIVEAQRRLVQAEARTAVAIRAKLRDRRTRWERTGARVTTAPLLRAQRVRRERLSALSRHVTRSFLHRAEMARGRLAQADRLLSTLSHRAILARGFALVTDGEGSLVRSSTEVMPGRPLVLTFSDGSADVIGAGAQAAPPAPAHIHQRKVAGSLPKVKTDQGSLF